ncbi:Alkaline phosphatase [Mesoflavibacter sp. HG96]|uniref:Alkaline phosphatase family protein n=1 Tax=Mesoflavibacter profundi TaxID=2708110 RepID=A0ABT4S0H1_9FLAO|nr:MULTISPECIES: alkaline phosphatase PafA [Mesoflavibacter]MDA0177250.1 alkaline phosphatase family protein [Mesoflavibacter profundi]QIJ88168.1 Alkaline phosphatase [Mesoflavibacter sp. HG96]QIJ90896.1 Alkaline phosphatase [Mesoflavibacter sp. HG37]
MRAILSVCIIFLILACQSQKQVVTSNTNNVTTTDLDKPKLVVGIVVDQMRYEYLTRFENKYGNGGFKRLINNGFNCKNNHFNYVPTYTGPGHASVFTGATPKTHGVIANNWYDKYSDSFVYCAGDTTVQSVGTLDKAGQMSPHRMKTTTFADENRLFTQMKGKTIGISIKDRGAILPAGHSANAAYWFHGKDEGQFISSTYYFDQLPQWVKTYNATNPAEKYLKDWNTLYDISTYTESGSDLNDFEGGFYGKETATFPYDLKTLSASNRGYDILKSTPYGNSLVTEFSIAALKGELLGQDNYTDVLTVSYSSTDYVGHNFGVNSKEIEDTYIRLDLEIEQLLYALDKQVGSGNYTVFLTADHGAVNVPAYLKSVKIPAGYFNGKDFKAYLDTLEVEGHKLSNWIKNISNQQIFLDHDKIASLNLDLTLVQNRIVNHIINYPGVDKAYTATTMATTQFNNGIEVLLQNGFNQKRSGDVLFVLDPAVIQYSHTGSTHGSPLNYDTHVPLLFYGNGILNGSTNDYTTIPDIAPTISALLGITFPNGATGKPLSYLLVD